MTLRGWLVLVAASAAFMGACTGGGGDVGGTNLREYANSFVPEDASDIEVAPNIPWVQVAFDVRREPLEFAVSADRLARAQADGWMLCQPQTSKWTGYEDQSATPSRYTQQRTYALYREGVLIMLLGMYYSDSERASVKKGEGQTERPVQHGVVIARNATDQEVTETASSMGLSCDGTPRD